MRQLLRHLGGRSGCPILQGSLAVQSESVSEASESRLQMTNQKKMRWANSAHLSSSSFHMTGKYSSSLTCSCLTTSSTVRRRSCPQCESPSISYSGYCTHVTGPKTHRVCAACRRKGETAAAHMSNQCVTAWHLLHPIHCHLRHERGANACGEQQRRVRLLITSPRVRVVRLHQVGIHFRLLVQNAAVKHRVAPLHPLDRQWLAAGARAQVVRICVSAIRHQEVNDLHVAETSGKAQNGSTEVEVNVRVEKVAGGMRVHGRSVLDEQLHQREVLLDHCKVKGHLPIVGLPQVWSVKRWNLETVRVARLLRRKPRHQYADDAAMLW